MAQWYCLVFLLLSCLLVTGDARADDKPPEPNVVQNAGFETDLSGWMVAGAVAIDHTTPLAGKGSLQMGPGVGAVRQRYPIGGLRIVYFGASLKAASSGVGGVVRARCYDAKNRLVMEQTQPLDAKGEDGNLHPVGLYFKTHAHTAALVVSIEKTAVTGLLFADTVVLTDYDRDKKSHRPAVDLDAYMQPLWKSNTITNETVLLRSDGGKSATGTLLFTPTQILSVQDYSLSTTYTPEKDYTIDGKRLTVTPGSRMPILTDSDLPKGDLPWLNLLGKHIVVTYSHEDKWTGPIPAYQRNRMSRTLKKLTGRSPITIVATGDSITLGNGTSAFSEIPPYMPTWGELVTHELKRRYGYSNITLYNTALGGMTSAWGEENAERAVASLKPDLVIIAFGMNDFWSLSRDDFLKNTKALMDRIFMKCLSVEFLLVSSMRFDPAYTADPTYTGHILEYARALETLAGDGIGFLDMTTLTGALFAAKAPKDFLADPLHPNDFLARWYAQSIVALLDSRANR